MTVKTVDARDMACPRPVIETRQALEDGAVHQLRVMVNTESAVENVTRTARSLGCEVQVDDMGGGETAITLNRESGGAASSKGKRKQEPKKAHAGERTAVLLTADTIGRGDDELGRVLAVAFVKTITQMVPAPEALIFLNSGVKLTTTGSELVDEIKELEEAGTVVLSCGTCLDFYGIKDSLEVGAVSNMFDIVSILASVDKTIRP